MKESRIRQLFEDRLTGQLSPEEEQEWLELMLDPAQAAERDQIIEEYYDRLPIGHSMEPEVADSIFRDVVQAPVRSLPVRRNRRVFLAAAVVLGIAAATGLWLWGGRKTSEKPVAENVYKNDIGPGGNHAVLTLSGGTTITLDSAATGKLASQGGTSVMKVNAGSLVYAKGTAGQAVVYNTLSTPAGGQYELTLSDGTHVWLNALSSIKFPATFGGQDRTVEMTGEVYFEVAKDGRLPFRVRAGGTDVDVLGTSFNVNAYADESSVKTTLQQGAVRLEANGKDLVLKPGQQGQSGGADAPALVKGADVDQAVAWRKGIFSFEDVDIHTVMRQLSRWYGITVRYEGQQKQELFSGKMGRDLSLTQVLTEMSQYDVHFSLEGKTLTVLP
jgi:transmembrane sensor